MDLLRRVRWGNVARAAALLAAVALIIAWPRLRAEPPPLPPEPALAAPQPVREESPEFGVEPSPAQKPRPDPAKSRNGGARSRRARVESLGGEATSRKRGARSRRRRAKAIRVAKPRSEVAPPAVSPASAPTPAWPPPPSEFGFGE